MKIFYKILTISSNCFGDRLSSNNINNIYTHKKNPKNINKFKQKIKYRLLLKNLDFFGNEFFKIYAKLRNLFVRKFKQTNVFNFRLLSNL